MTKKTALFVLALVSAAQAESSCDVTSRLYGGVGLGFSNAHAPILKNKGLGAAFDNKFKKLSAADRQNIDPSKMKSGAFYKKMRALSGRLALGGHFVVPNTWLVLGAEASFGLGGAKGQIKENLENTNIARAAAPAVPAPAPAPAPVGGGLGFVPPAPAAPVPAPVGRRGRGRAAAPAVPAPVPAAPVPAAHLQPANAKGAYTLALRDRWNMALTGIVGAKVGRFLPYAKVGVALHSFKVTKSFSGTYGGESFNEPTTTRKKKALFVMGLGAEYNVTKNIIMGAEWTHHRGSLGLINKAERKVASKQNKKMDKIRTNEFMVTCKYAFPVN